MAHHGEGFKRNSLQRHILKRKRRKRREVVSKKALKNSRPVIFQVTHHRVALVIINFIMSIGSATTGRTLTEEEMMRLMERDKVCVSNFKREKLEADAKKNWDLFYKRNSTHFFKDRHWITREFPQLREVLHEVRSVLSWTHDAKFTLVVI